jgi:hypothetical protein
VIVIEHTETKALRGRHQGMTAEGVEEAFRNGSRIRLDSADDDPIGDDLANDVPAGDVPADV